MFIKEYKLSIEAKLLTHKERARQKCSQAEKSITIRQTNTHKENGPTENLKKFASTIF